MVSNHGWPASQLMWCLSDQESSKELPLLELDGRISREYNRRRII